MGWGAALVFLTACGRIGFPDLAPGRDGALGDTAPTGDGAPHTDALTGCAWNAPTLVNGVNGGLQDWEPAVSPDGLTLVFNRQILMGAPHLFLSHRASVAAPFSAPVQVLATTGDEASPSWSPDGNTLYFVSNSGATMTFRLYQSAFDAAAVAFAAPSPVSELAVDMFGPTISRTDLELFYNNAVGTPAIRWASRPTATSLWQDRGVIPELMSSTGDGWASLSPDGLTIYFESNRDDPKGLIYSATRPSIGGTWSNVAKVTDLDGGVDDGDPDVSPDGLTIYFASDRGAFGLADIYVATRACI